MEGSSSRETRNMSCMSSHAMICNIELPSLLQTIATSDPSLGQTATAASTYKINFITSVKSVLQTFWAATHI